MYVRAVCLAVKSNTYCAVAASPFAVPFTHLLRGLNHGVIVFLVNCVVLQSRL